MDINTPAWVRDAVFYQIFPDRLARSGRVEPPGDLEAWDASPTVDGFKGGDLYGVAEHLDRLRALGINALYLNPIFTSASNHRYHTDDYFSVDPLLGGNEALRELLDQAHARDIRVVLDGVFNHSGRGWFPFHHVLESGMASPYRDWFYLSDAVRRGAQAVSAFPSPEQLAEIDRRHGAGVPLGGAAADVLGFECWWDLPKLPKIRLDDPRARAHILDVAEYWVRFGIDGWRLDVAEEIGADFWREFRVRVRSANPEAYIVGEVWMHKPDWLEGDMFDAFMNYPLTRAILGFSAQDHWDPSQPIPNGYQGEDAVVPLDGRGFWDRIEVLERTNHPEVTAAQLNLLGSHDTPRALTLCGEDAASIRIASLLQLTLPGAPCIYYGDEIGMSGSMDPYCRGAFPTDRGQWERDPYGWVADLVELRHSSPAFRDAELTLLGTHGPAVAYLRRDGDAAYAVVANAGADTLDWDVPLPLFVDATEVMPLRGGEPGARRAELVGEDLRIGLAARDGMVVRLTVAG